MKLFEGVKYRDSIEVDASAEDVFEWLCRRSMDKESYKAWHPDHVDVRWIKGEPLQAGSIFYAEENIRGDLYKLKFKIIRIVPNREIRYRILFPLSLIATENAFIIEPKGKNSCTFTATGGLRIPAWMFRNIHKKHRYKIEATQQHMKEEGENLKRALESQEKS